jgi:ATP-dependent Clp protease adaptor protein ClpS
MTKEKINPVNLSDEGLEQLRELVLFNDDVNTFEFVIESLIEVCKHQPEQAEQCALVAHFKGRCGVRQGDIQSLRPLNTEMSKRGLTVTIE